jgi:hypothetical protein
MTERTPFQEQYAQDHLANHRLLRQQSLREVQRVCSIAHPRADSQHLAEAREVGDHSAGGLVTDTSV